MADWASNSVPELSNPLDQVIVAKFKAHYRAKRKYPKDCAAAYQLWILREPEFAKRNDRPRSNRSRLLEGVLKEAHSSEPQAPMTHADGP